MLKRFFYFFISIFFSFAWLIPAKADVILVTLPYIIEETQNMTWLSFFLIFFIFVVIIKFLFFFAFGSRHFINYGWLFIATSASYCLNLFFSQLGNESTILIALILGIIVGFFTEYFILKFFLHKRYSKKEIRLFVLTTSILVGVIEISIIFLPFFLNN